MQTTADFDSIQKKKKLKNIKKLHFSTFFRKVQTPYVFGKFRLLIPILKIKECRIGLRRYKYYIDFLYPFYIERTDWRLETERHG